MFQLHELFESLALHKVKYLLCGGLAVNLYGIPRMTADIDLILEWEKENIEKFEKILKENKYRSNLYFQFSNLISATVRQQMVKEKNLIAYSFTSDSLQQMALDVIIDCPINFEIAWERRNIKLIKKAEVNVVSIGDLILLKEYANREQDKLDIINLKKFDRNV